MLFTVMSTARIALGSYFKGYYNFIVQKEMISLNKNTLGVKKVRGQSEAVHIHATKRFDIE